MHVQGFNSRCEWPRAGPQEIPSSRAPLAASSSDGSKQMPAAAGAPEGEDGPFDAYLPDKIGMRAAILGRKLRTPPAIEVAACLDGYEPARNQLGRLQCEIEVVGEKAARPRSDPPPDVRLAPVEGLCFEIDTFPPLREQLPAGENLPHLFGVASRMLQLSSKRKHGWP